MPTIVIVLLAVGGVLVVLGLVGGIVAYRFFRGVTSSPIGQETNRSMDSPGAPELMRFGCNPISVIDTASMPELTDLYRNDPRRPVQPVDVPLIIECGPGLGTARSCDEVRTEYLRVAHPTTSFRVFVRGYDAKPFCNQRYDAKGQTF